MNEKLSVKIKIDISIQMTIEGQEAINVTIQQKCILSYYNQYKQTIKTSGNKKRKN